MDLKGIRIPITKAKMAGIPRNELDEIGNLAIDLLRKFERNHPVPAFEEVLWKAVNLWEDAYDGVYPIPGLGHRKELNARLWFQVVAAQLRDKNLRVMVQSRSKEPWSSRLLAEARLRRSALLGGGF
jgi:hypothetical protein